MGAWEFHFTWNMWCWDDASWLGLCYVNATNWIPIVLLLQVNWVSTMFDACWLGLGDIISVSWLELGNGACVG